MSVIIAVNCSHQIMKPKSRAKVLVRISKEGAGAGRYRGRKRTGRRITVPFPPPLPSFCSPQVPFSFFEGGHLRYLQLFRERFWVKRAHDNTYNNLLLLHSFSNIKHTPMASNAILDLSDFPEIRKSRNRRDIKTIHNNFRQCRVHFLPTTFLVIHLITKPLQRESRKEFRSLFIIADSNKT